VGGLNSDIELELDDSNVEMSTMIVKKRDIVAFMPWQQ
jgi:hypothetical protein